MRVVGAVHRIISGHLANPENPDDGPRDPSADVDALLRLDRIARHPQLFGNLPHLHWFTFVGEDRVAGDHSGGHGPAQPELLILRRSRGEVVYRSPAQNVPNPIFRAVIGFIAPKLSGDRCPLMAGKAHA